MALHKDQSGNIYDDMDGTAINLLPSGCVQITQQEADALLVQSVSASDMWGKIKSHRDFLTENGGYLASGKWFHSDKFSRTQQLGLILYGQSMPAGIMWKTMDGTFIEMTPTLALEILQAATAQDVAVFQAAEVHKAAMEASQTPGAYDFSTGWPATFLG